MDRPLTKPQVMMLTRGMREGAAVSGPRYRVAGNLVAQQLGGVTDGLFRPNAFGLKALRDYRARRWGKHGCMAYLAQLEEVEAAIEAAGAEVR